MVEEFYPEDLVQRSQQLYEQVKAWGLEAGEVTVIGGWAVYEHVEPTRAQRSRDLDLLFHTEQRLKDFAARMPDWGLAWQQDGRRTFKACQLRDKETSEIAVDVFTDGVFWRSLFGRQAAQNVKDAQDQPFVPDLEYLLEDKVRTLPKRLAHRDGERKALKDCLDVRNLVFHNTQGLLPRALAEEILSPHRRKAADVAREVSESYPDFSDDLAEAIRWLEL